MMRETVCIVLNERESPKARAAEALQKMLSGLGITASRVEVTEHIEKILLNRAPMVLVLDYLLGDYSTGLDVLQRFHELPEEQRPQVFFLTDEPSVQVAVDAMRLGAANYLEIDHPQSIHKIAREIAGAVSVVRARQETPRTKENAARSKVMSPDDLVAHATATRKLIQQLKIIAQKKFPITVIYGEAGTGKMTAARALHASRESPSVLREVSLRTCTSTPEILSNAAPFCFGPRLGAGLSLLVSHAEEDDGELLDFIAHHLNELWPNTSQNTQGSFLTIMTSSPDHAKAWQRLIPECESIQIPALAQRLEDLPSLVQRFLVEASELGATKIKSFDADTMRWLSTQPWPGNVRELRSVIINTSLSLHDKNTLSSHQLQQRLAEMKSLWLEQETLSAQELPVSSFAAANLLHAWGNRQRAVAAFLGCSVAALRKLTASNSGEEA